MATRTTQREPNLGPPPPTLDDPLLSPPMPQTETRRVVGEPVEEQVSEITQLTEDEQLLFSSLLTVGQRSKTIDVMGHTVTIQSLCVSDDLRISLYCKKYEDTRGLSRAYQLAVCAAGVRAIDHAPLFQPLSQATSNDEIFEQKAEYLKDFYPIVISQIYDAIVKLDTEFAELAKKLGKLPG